MLKITRNGKVTNIHISILRYKSITNKGYEMYILQTMDTHYINNEYIIHKLQITNKEYAIKNLQKSNMH